MYLGVPSISSIAFLFVCHVIKGKIVLSFIGGYASNVEEIGATFVDYKTAY